MSPGNFVINFTGAGDHTLVAAPPTPSFIEVSHYRVTVDSPTVLTFTSGASGDVLDKCYATVASGGGISTPFTYDALLRCNPGQALVVNSSSAVNVGGAGNYSVVGVLAPTGWGVPFGS